jgi:hypothetical protein
VIPVRYELNFYNLHKLHASNIEATSLVWQRGQPQTKEAYQKADERSDRCLYATPHLAPDDPTEYRKEDALQKVRLS